MDGLVRGGGSPELPPALLPAWDKDAQVKQCWFPLDESRGSLAKVRRCQCAEGHLLRSAIPEVPCPSSTHSFVYRMAFLGNLLDLPDSSLTLEHVNSILMQR